MTRSPLPPRARALGAAPLLAVLLVLALALAGCSRGPVPIAYGSDECDFCRMAISDPRYGAELVTTRGKVHKFDSIECMASYYLQADPATVHQVVVSDFAHPGTFIPATEATFRRGGAGPSSPMGAGLRAYRADAAPAGALAGSGEVLSWTQVLAVAHEATRHDHEVAHDDSSAPAQDF